MQGGGTGEKGEVDLEDIELDFDALRHAVIPRSDDGRDSAEGDEALERTGPRVNVKLPFFTTKPTETMRRRCSVCQIVQYDLFLIQLLYTTWASWRGRAINAVPSDANVFWRENPPGFVFFLYLRYT